MRRLGLALGVSGGEGTHLGEPAGEAQQLPALAGEEAGEVARADGLCVEAGVGFEPPAEVGASPGAEAVAAGGVPEKAESFEDGRPPWRGWAGAAGAAWAGRWARRPVCSLTGAGPGGAGGCARL